MNSLKGKVALITGSGQGVGKGIAEYFAKEGAIVITNSRGKIDAKVPEYLCGEELKKYLALKSDAHTVAEQIKAEGNIAEAYFCDVSNHERVREMTDSIIKKYGRLDILVNNAAVTQATGFLTTSERDWDLQMSVKVKGAYNCIDSVLPYMIRQGGGVILNCASDAWVGLNNAAAYSAANAALAGLTRSIAQEFSRYQISCNAFCPQAASPGHIAGFSRTLQGMGKGVMLSDDVKERIEKNHRDAIYLGPFLAYLCTEAGKKISGGIFSVTASGNIGYYEASVRHNSFSKQDDAWSVEELSAVIPGSDLANSGIKI